MLPKVEVAGCFRASLEHGSVIAKVFRLGSQENWIGIGLAVEDRACRDGGPGQGMTRRHAGAVCAARHGHRAGRRHWGGRDAKPARPLDDGAAPDFELGHDDVPGAAVVAHGAKLLVGVSGPLDFESYSFLLRNS